MYEITEYKDTELTKEVVTPIATLASRSFMNSERPLELRISEMMAGVGSDDPEKTTGRRFVIWQDERAIAHARTFVRHIFVEQQEIPVLALATVCSDPDLRGKGLGVLVTKAAFQQVTQPEWPDVCLFQTPVPVFYEKLDSRLVANRFVNLQNEKDPEANPWRDDKIMIHPANFAWPDGTVNLNGPDY